MDPYERYSAARPAAPPPRSADYPRTSVRNREAELRLFNEIEKADEEAFRKGKVLIDSKEAELRTISEDFTDGKLSHKDKALKNLAKDTGLNSDGERRRRRRTYRVRPPTVHLEPTSQDFQSFFSQPPKYEITTSPSPSATESSVSTPQHGPEGASSLDNNLFPGSEINVEYDEQSDDRLSHRNADEENRLQQDAHDESVRNGDSMNSADIRTIPAQFAGNIDKPTNVILPCKSRSVQVFKATNDIDNTDYINTLSFENGIKSHSSLKRRVSTTTGLLEAQPKRARTNRSTPYSSLADESGENVSNRAKIVYRIRCRDSLERYHDAPAFEDPPLTAPPRTKVSVKRHRSYRGISGLRHLNGALPIYDINSYVEQLDDDIDFVTIRNVNCEENQACKHTSARTLKWHETLVILSSKLEKSILEVAQCYYSDFDPNMRFEKGMVFSHAKLFLFHHERKLIEYAETHTDVRTEISSLLEYSSQLYGHDFEDARQTFAKGFVSQKHLDKLYAPNDIVIDQEGDTKRGYVVSQWPVSNSLSGGLRIHCWAWKNNGTDWVRDRHDFDLPPISGDAKIQSLALCPATHVADETKNTLIERGRKLWNLKNPSHISYTGNNFQGDEYYPESRFIIDYNVYKKIHGDNDALLVDADTPLALDRWPTELDASKSPTSDEMILFPGTVHGFYLTEKQWVCLFVDGVHEIKWNKTAFDHLVIPAKTKELVRALVMVRKSQRGIKHGLGVAGKRVDIMSGKGNGLIMLLHGGPGTGKSLTAESVAEIAEMPLYRVTCGDIGTTAEAVEKYMGIVMHLGVTWNCVLLLDEADVFLEERSMSDLARNSLVSVFLRILEYYDGVLILTSNRIGTFDEAFKSRIQVALHYEKLTIASRKKIWTNFINMLEEDEEDVNFQEIRYKLDDVAKIDLNGRQIRNALTTARQIAMFQACRLDWHHIEQALTVSSDFNQYLMTMQGHTDDQRARDEKIR